jgi:hypothetical protein
MVIIPCLYLALVWLIFSRLRLTRWGSGTVTVLVGAFILAVFLALFNYLTPSGSIIVASRVVEVIPNVSGEIVSVPKAVISIPDGYDEANLRLGNARDRYGVCAERRGHQGHPDLDQLVHNLFVTRRRGRTSALRGHQV